VTCWGNQRNFSYGVWRLACWLGRPDIGQIRHCRWPKSNRDPATVIQETERTKSAGKTKRPADSPVSVQMIVRCHCACCERKQKWNQQREEDANTCTTGRGRVRHYRCDRKSPRLLSYRAGLYSGDALDLCPADAWFKSGLVVGHLY
jgi:hypothetical protein